MNRDIQFLINMSKFNLYEGFSYLKDTILLQDNIDENFTENDFFDLLSYTLLYHQIIENMLTSLLIQYNYYRRLSIYPKSFKDIKIPAKFSKKMELLQNIDFTFNDKNELIQKCKWINKFRNKLAHHAIETNKYSIIKNLKISKDTYHRIQEIYQTTTINLYNEISQIINCFESFISNDIDYSKEITELKLYIKNNWDNIDIHMPCSITLKLYIYIYNHLNTSEPLDELYVLNCLLHSKNEIFKYLKLESNQNHIH